MNLTHANQQTSAEWNRQTTLRLLRQHGALSRRQLAQMTGLRGSTLTYIMRELLERGLVRTAGKRLTRRAGQKQILLEINPDLGYTAGLDLRRGTARLLLRDMAGQVLDDASIRTGDEAHLIPGLLRHGIEDRLHRLRGLKGRLLGVAVGVPGIVDAQRGVILNSIPLDVRDFPLRDVLRVALDTPNVLVDHNANYAALAESREGAARHLTHFVHFLINHEAARSDRAFKAFGAALFLDGRVYHGVHFGAGELDGKLAPTLDFPLDAAELALLAQPEAELTDHLQQLAAAAAQSIASIANLLDPQAVIVGDGQVIANRRFLELLEQATLRRIIPIHRRTVSILPSTLGHRAVALGGAIAAADEAFTTSASPALAAAG